MVNPAACPPDSAAGLPLGEGDEHEAVVKEGFWDSLLGAGSIPALVDHLEIRPSRGDFPLDDLP